MESEEPVNANTIIALGLVFGAIFFATLYDPLKSTLIRGYKERKEWLEAQERYYNRRRNQ
jgi:hypothetical protein